MSRRPGVVDRHALLSTSAYPSSYRGGVANGGAAASSSGLNMQRAISPFEQPYGGGGDSSDPYAAEYNIRGAPKKEPPLSAYSNGGVRKSNTWGLRTAEQLEEQNDEHLEGLSAKVRILKDITVGIGNEVRDSTKDLDSLSEAFNNTSAFLGNTFTRMNHMERRQGGWFCNMMLFLLFVIWIFVFLWWWRR